MTVYANPGKLFTLIFLVTISFAPLQLSAQEQTAQLQSPLENSASAQGSAVVTVTGRVLDDATGEPVPGASVSLLDRSTHSDEQGAFTFNDVPSSRSATLNIRVLDIFGDVIGCSPIEVVVTLYPLAANSEDSTAIVNLETMEDMQVTLRLVPLTGAILDEACSECHKPNPCLATVDEPDQWDTVDHLKGIAVPIDEHEEFIAKIQAEGLTSDMYTSLRYQDAHLQGVKILTGDANGAHFKRPTTLPLGIDGTLHCDTCHTRHEPTAFSAFSRLDFEEQSTLCIQCHL